MFDKIKLLASDTAVYGVSTILGRFLNFLLVPFYTNVLLPGEYGIVTYLFSLLAFCNVLYSYGMESAYMRFVSSLEMGDKKQNFSTPFVSILLTSLFLSLLVSFFAAPLAEIVSLPVQNRSLIYYAAWILCFDALTIIPFAALRMERSAKQFATLKFLNIFTTVLLNVIFLTQLQMGIEGIFLSQLIASILTFVLLLPTIIRNFSFDFSSSLYRALLKFGLPYIPAGISTMMVQVVDRPILRAMTNDSTVGIYQANYRLGILMMLVVSVFDTAWKPFFLSYAKEANAKELFSRILTYFILLMTVIFLFVTFFVGDVVKISVFGFSLIHEKYWEGLSIVPVVLFGYMWLGISNNIVAGIYIEKKTSLLPPITFLGAAVNVVGNIFLIPSLGIIGAAWATFLSYFLMTALLYFKVQKIYPIEYEYLRVGKIATAGIIVFVLSIFFFQETGSVVWKIFLLFAFFFGMFGMKVFTYNEISRLRSIIKSPFQGKIIAPSDESAKF
ncbi:MAG: oligosaccharide flippase family protein [Ignavibacteriales bacterium]|nr:oligosaccharide flippase family protein [Ignavibacteriales bacterium]